VGVFGLIQLGVLLDRAELGLEQLRRSQRQALEEAPN